MKGSKKDIKLKDIIDKFSNPEYNPPIYKNTRGSKDRYPWGRLKASIEKNGILENIKVRAIPSVRKYRVIEGNHRIKILKELYGDDYIQSCIVDNMSESPSSPEGTSGLSYNAEAISNDGRPLHK